jgi:CcmD family protein
MYEFLEQHAIYVVMIIVLMIWAGLFLYINRVDRNLKNLE